MPFTRQQVNRILHVGSTPFIDPERLPHLGLRITESYLRRLLYSWEDRAVTQQWRIFDAAVQRIQQYALIQASQRRIDPLGNTLDSRQWVRDVQTYADGRLNEATQLTALEAYAASLTAWAAGYYGKAWQADVVTRPDVQVNVPALDMRRAEPAVLLPDVREAVEPNLGQYAALGEDWRASYEAERDEMRIKVRRALKRAMLEGLGVLEALRQVREAVGLSNTLQAGVTQNFYRMQTLTRTALVDAMQDGGETLWRANTKDAPRSRFDDALGVLLLSQVRVITANDERVCFTCRGYDGQVSSLFDLGRPRPPFHSNCRCNEVPVIAERLLIDADRYPGQTWDEWLVGFGGGLLLDDFLQAGLTSTQV